MYAKYYINRLSLTRKRAALLAVRRASNRSSVNARRPQSTERGGGTSRDAMADDDDLYGGYTATASSNVRPVPRREPAPPVPSLDRSRAFFAPTERERRREPLRGPTRSALPRFTPLTSTSTAPSRPSRSRTTRPPRSTRRPRPGRRDRRRCALAPRLASSSRRARCQLCIQIDRVARLSSLVSPLSRRTRDPPS